MRSVAIKYTYVYANVQIFYILRIVIRHVQVFLENSTLRTPIQLRYFGDRGMNARWCVYRPDAGRCELVATNHIDQLGL